ncbi:MAG: type II toxin-antitoxin system RelE/ParE family toxin [Planctomycetes bacterium]|nr:type II toxin-antitoxin system RelE/ParE family toxin [Planctomycetota bacterium]
MSLPVVLRTVARAEYLGAIAYYESEQPGLGADFESAVQIVLDVIANTPERYPIARRDIREAPTQRFPFCVYYRVRKDRVVVIAVFHQSRDPAEWQARS